MKTVTIDSVSDTEKMTKDVSWPLNDIDPKMKDEVWGLSAARALWSDFGGWTYFNQRRQTFRLNKLYREGKQPSDIYKPYFNCSPGVLNPDESLLNLNFNIVSFVPNMMNQVKNTIMKRGFGLGCEAVNRGLVAARELDKWYAKAAKELAPFTQKMSEIAGVDLTPSKAKNIPNEAQDLPEELQIWPKMKEETEMESALWMYLQKNKSDEIVDGMIEDVISCGVMGWREWVEDGTIKAKRCLPENSVFKYGIDQDFRNSPYFGEVVELSIGELKKLAPGKWNDEQLFDIAKKSTAAVNWMFADYLKNTVVNDFWFARVNVLLFEYKTYNFVGRKTKKSKSTGADKVYSDVKDFDGENVIKTSFKCFYEGAYLIDLDQMVYWRKQNYQGRKPYIKGESEEFSDAVPTYHFYSPGMYHGVTSSLIDQVRPFADAFMLQNLNYQRNAQTQIPQGIIFNLQSLSNIPTKGQGVMNPLDVMEVIRKTGSGVLNPMDETGRPLTNSALFEFNPGSGVAPLKDCISIMMDQIVLAQKALGLSDIMLGFTPEERSSVRNQQASAASSVNAIAHLTEAVRNVFSAGGTGMMYRIQWLRKKLAEKGENMIGSYAPNGSMQRRYVDIGDGIADAHFDLLIFERPDGESMQELKETINLAIAKREQTGKGGLELADKIYIMDLVERGGNMKLAWQYLNYRQSMYKKQDAAVEQEAAKARMQEAAAINQQASQLEAQKVQMKIQGDLAIEQEVSKREMSIMAEKTAQLEKEIQLRMIEFQLKYGTQVEIQNSINKTTLEKTNRDNETKLEVSENQKDRQVVAK